MKKIAVIILNWNGEDLLRKFLPSVCAHTNADIADVIVVDNGSDDNSVEVLKQEFPQVKTLLFPQNYPSFFAHMEEIDLCWRIHLAGYRIAVVPQSTVYHLGGASLDAANPRKTYLNFRNNLLMLHKNLPCKEGKKTLFVRRLYDTLAFVRFALLGQFSHARAILRAHNDFRQMRKRYTEFPNTDLLKTFPESGRNITIDYFLKGKKRFR